MSLFTENSWEANTLADKLSKEIFTKRKRKGKVQGKSEKLSKKRKLQSDENNRKPSSEKKKKKTKNALNSNPNAELVGQVRSPASKWQKKSTHLDKKVFSGTKLQGNRTQAKEKKLTQRLPTNDQPPAGNESKAERRKKKRNRKQKTTGKLESTGVESTNVASRDVSRNGKNKTAENLESPSAESMNAASKDVLEKTMEKISGKKGLDIKRLERMLADKETTPKTKPAKSSETLRERMMSQLRASRFRFLNETLYNNDSSQSKLYFKEDPDAFMAYHAGYKQQVEQWPVNPLDVIITSINKMPKDYVIADLGCGEARLANSVPQKVHSFDIVALNDRVKACDMSHTPLLTNSMNVVVFCLSLMGTNLGDYLIEANRVLKNDGILKIAEVESRFEKVDEFIKLLQSYGFNNTWTDLSHNLFYFMDFKKVAEVNARMKKLPQIALKPCLYKKR